MSNFKEQLLKIKKQQENSLLKEQTNQEKERLAQIDYANESLERLKEITDAIEGKIKPLFEIFNNTMLDSEATYNKKIYDETKENMWVLSTESSFRLDLKENYYINLMITRKLKTEYPKQSGESIKIELITGSSKIFRLEIDSIFEQDLMRVEKFVEQCLLKIDPKKDMYSDPSW